MPCRPASQGGGGLTYSTQPVSNRCSLDRQSQAVRIDRRVDDRPMQLKDYGGFWPLFLIGLAVATVLFMGFGVMLLGLGD